MDQNDIMVSFEWLLPNVPIVDTMNIVKKQLGRDSSLSTLTNLPFDGVIDFLNMCLKSVYFQYEDRFYLQRDGLSMD